MCPSAFRSLIYPLTLYTCNDLGSVQQLTLKRMYYKNKIKCISCVSYWMRRWIDILQSLLNLYGAGCVLGHGPLSHPLVFSLIRSVVIAFTKQYHWDKMFRPDKSGLPFRPGLVFRPTEAANTALKDSGRHLHWQEPVLYVGNSEDSVTNESALSRLLRVNYENRLLSERRRFFFFFLFCCQLVLISSINLNVNLPSICQTTFRRLNAAIFFICVVSYLVFVITYISSNLLG